MKIKRPPMSKVWVDPPSGWQYGFPRVYDEAEDGPCWEWMVSKGYPESMKELADRATRCWDYSENS